MQVYPCPAQLGLGCIFTDVELFGDFLMGIAIDGIHVKYDPVSRREFFNHAEQLFGDKGIVATVRTHFHIGFVDVCRQKHVLLFAQEAEAFIDDGAFDPSFEAAFVAELFHAAEDICERSDEDIFGIHRIPDIAAAQGIHLRGKCIIEVFLGVPFAAEAPFDQFLFVHRDGMRSNGLDSLYRRWKEAGGCVEQKIFTT